jgi:hypothetical protein
MRLGLGWQGNGRKKAVVRGLKSSCRIQQNKKIKKNSL